MLADTFAMPTAKRRRGDALALTAGLYALAAIAFVAVVDLCWGLTHQNYSYVADTISDLAAGVNSWTMDVALTGFALAVAVVALALLRWDLGARTGHTWRYRVGCLLALALAPVLYFIAAHDAYGDGEAGGFVIHHHLVYTLGALFPLTAWATAPGFADVSRAWRNLSLVLALIWLPAAPYFMFMGTSWDGLFERGLALILLVWFGAAAFNLVRRGRGLL